MYTTLFPVISLACNNIDQNSKAAPSSTISENNKGKHWKNLLLLLLIKLMVQLPNQSVVALRQPGTSFMQFLKAITLKEHLE
jgi:hypothetical protein